MKASGLAIAVRKGLGAGSTVLLLSPVVYSQGAYGPVVELSDLNGTDGFVINGIDEDEFSGTSVSDLELHT